MPATKVSVEIQAPAKTVYEVITDFEEYPEFLSETKKVVIKEETAKSATVEFTISVIKKIQYTLEFKLTPHKAVSWQLIEGDPLMKKNSGKWKLTEKKGITHAEYELEVDLGNLPKAISKKLVESNLPTMLHAFRDRAEEIA